MNIGIAEVLYPKGHKELNINTVNILSRVANIYCFNSKDFFDVGRIADKVNVIDLRWQYDLQHFEKLITYTRVLNLKEIAKAIRKNRIKLDALIFLSFDNSLIPYVNKIFAGIEIYVIHHDDIDKIPDNLKPNEKDYYNSIKHLVYEEYIKEGLINKTDCNFNNVFVIPHPLVFNFKREKIKTNEKIVLGIGWSNDEQLINMMIEYSKKIKYSLPYKIILRSKKQSYKDSNLEVISGFLSKEKYDQLICNADIQIILYPDSFKYRYSATFQTAVLQNSFVLVNDVFIGNELKKLYPKSVHIIKSIQELFELDESLFQMKPHEEDIKHLIFTHDDDYIETAFRNIFDL